MWQGAGRLWCRRHQGRASRRQPDTTPGPFCGRAARSGAVSVLGGVLRQQAQRRRGSDRTGRGWDRFRRLADEADILIESFRPGHLSGLGLGYDDLSATNPGLVYTSVTPFGQTGPYSQYLAPDMVAWSMGGMQYICGDADRPPVRVSAPQAELHAGGQAAMGTMSAYWHRQNTGQGQHVDVSMQTSVMWTLMNATPFPPLHGINLERSGAFRSTGQREFRQVFQCRDGHVTILSNPRTMAPFTEWMAEEGAAPGWLLEIEWDSWKPPNPEEEPDRADQFQEIQRLVVEFAATKTKEELYLRAIRDRMLIAPCNSVGDIAPSVQLEARDFWTKVDYPALGRSLTHLGPFIKMSESPIRVSHPAPRVGEHDDDVLADVKDPSQKSLGTISPSPQSSPIKGEEDSIAASLGAMPFRRVESSRLHLGRGRADHYEAPGRLWRGRDTDRVCLQAGRTSQCRAI